MVRLLLQELRFRLAGMLGWGLGLCFFPVVYVGLYPSLADQMASFNEIMDLAIYQAMGISMASFEGYMASTVTNLVPLILCIYAVSNGTGTLAGEEDDGRLELIVALPIPRWQIVLVKAISLGISLLVILTLVSAGAALTLQTIVNQIDTQVTPLDVFVGLLSAWPLAMAVGMISLFLGAFSPSRRIASVIATVVVLASYLGSNLAGMVKSLVKIEAFFLFHYYEATANALINGQQAGNQLVLLLILLAAFGLAAFFFQIRNLTVGAWPWQRGKVERL
ncbi:MAG: ABC transporter permease subunit [Anaerolineales bacterium]|nr:ABC transporter permease subunit [Anaerolineales bacterium]